MSDRHAAHLRRARDHARILLFVPGEYAGPCFIGFAIGESLGASALRIAGGIFTKIADIGSDLMKIVFKIKEDDARNPGVIADCTGDNAGDSVGPTADGFETYGVTGVALITFILLAVADTTVQVQLIVWIFVMRILMIGHLGRFLLHQRSGGKASTSPPTRLQLRAPAHLPRVAHLHHLHGRHLRRVLPDDPEPRGRHPPVVEALHDHQLRHPRGRHHPRTREDLHLHRVRHVKEVVIASREGGASLNILAGLVAGNFSPSGSASPSLGLMGVAASRLRPVSLRT
jgi:K(+)-stimulated pyrophosphate-energized sodium pump